MQEISAMDAEIEQLVQDCLQKLGFKSFKEEIRNLLRKNDEKDILTIIVNEGIYPSSPTYDHGEIYIASGGNIDFSSKDVVEKEFNKILIGVAQKLKSKPW